MIARGSKKATGVIIGITGPWGSGKSSILNLLDSCIKENHPDAIVVRFDPWLISGRNDLISEFIAELIAELQQTPDGKTRFKAAISRLVDYGNTPSPLATLVPYGTAVKDALKMARDHLDRQKSLHEQRRELMEALAGVAAPIVVLIDELDRIEDEEIRIVAQLVRSIAVFPGISYVLAYDVERVIRALAGSEKLERGRTYLEKIVQLQFPLPILMDDEIHRLIDADLDELCAAGLIPENRSTVVQYAGLRSVLVPRLIATPRDVKRLTGAFSILLRMLSNEVYWVDLLGFCALLVKAPLTVEQIKRDPDAVVDDPTSVDEIVERASDRRDRASDRQAHVETVLKRVNPENEGGSEVQRLLGFLFPRLCEDGVGYRPQPRTSASLCKMRPLLTTLRLDLVPGFYSRDEVQKTFSLSHSDVAVFLHETFQQNRIGNFLIKLGDLQEELSALPQKSFWQGVSQFLKKLDSEFVLTSSPMYETTRSFSSVFLKIKDCSARALFLHLLARGDVEITGLLIRSHVFHYGLFGHSPSNNREVFLERAEVEEIARDTARKYREQHLAGRFLWSQWQFNPVYTMIDTGVWDDDCRARVQDFLTDDPRAIDALTLMFYGDGYTTGRDAISKIVDLEEYLKLVDQRLAAGNLDEPVRLSLEKAKNPVFG